MHYTLTPLDGNVVIIDLRPQDIQQITGRKLIDLGQRGHDVLQYGRVIAVASDVKKVKAEDIVLYSKLAADKTSLGEDNAWQILVSAEHIIAKIVEGK